MELYHQESQVCIASLVFCVQAGGLKILERINAEGIKFQPLQGFNDQRIPIRRELITNGSYAFNNVCAQVVDMIPIG